MAAIDPDILEELSARNIVLAYASGVFPMVEHGQLRWFSPDPRGLMPLGDGFHLSASLQRTIRRGQLVCTVDRAFREVVRACARRDRPRHVWISPEVEMAYCRLHALGLAHSVETWPADAVGEGAPTGGLYGVTLGGAFFAESMFHRQTDAGKVALAALVERLTARGYRLCDVQWTTPNLRRFGAFDVDRETYLDRLTAALALRCRFD